MDSDFLCYESRGKVRVFLLWLLLRRHLQALVHVVSQTSIHDFPVMWPWIPLFKQIYTKCCIYPTNAYSTPHLCYLAGPVVCHCDIPQQLTLLPLTSTNISKGHGVPLWQIPTLSAIGQVVRSWVARRWIPEAGKVMCHVLPQHHICWNVVTSTITCKAICATSPCSSRTGGWVGVEGYMAGKYPLCVLAAVDWILQGVSRRRWAWEING